ncbi:MAG: transglutaminase family protein [Betaproteobacteria bacterium]|nr:transglutaminase family protein [Betaproteobacteria bacterium]
MFYRVIHETRYVYASRVAVAQQLLHLTPRELPWQRRVAHAIAIDPQPSETSEHVDYFGNPVCHAVLASPHDTLTVRVESDVSVGSRGSTAALSGSPPWESVRAWLHACDLAPVLEAAEFLFESPHVRFSAGLADYALTSFSAGRPFLDAVLDLNHRIHGDFLFDASAAGVATPIAEVFELRRGVCQDFAHPMTGCLRVLGLPARYVSGYVLTTPPPGHAPLIGVDASHAWVSAYCPAGGWIDFDPTNDLVVNDQHITLAWGRDLSDVAPMRGVILGGGEQELEVRVTMTRAEGAAELSQIETPASP